MASKIDLISSALVLIGGKPINSLTGNTREQLVANSLYDRIVKNEISKHRWGFARKKAQLSLTTENPVDDEYSYIYQLPTDKITLIKIRPSFNYQIYGDKLYTNTNQAIYCDYIYEAPESEWPEYFSQMIIYALAVDFAQSIRDSSSIQQNVMIQYRSQQANAMFVDSQEHPQQEIVDRPLIDVRF